MQRTEVDGCQKGSSRAHIKKVKIPSSSTHSLTTFSKFSCHLGLFQIFCVLRRVVLVDVVHVNTRDFSR
jgi:hypothetical protein